MHAHLLTTGYLHMQTHKKKRERETHTTNAQPCRDQHAHKCLPSSSQTCPPLPTQDELCSRVTTISFRGRLVHMGFPKSSVMWTLAFKRLRVKPLQIIAACRGGGTHHSEVAVQRPAVKGMTKEPVQLLLDGLGDHCPVRR